MRFWDRRSYLLYKLNNSEIYFEIFIKLQEQKHEQFCPYIDSMMAFFGYRISSTNHSLSHEDLPDICNGLQGDKISSKTARPYNQSRRNLIARPDYLGNIPQYPTNNIFSSFCSVLDVRATSTLQSTRWTRQSNLFATPKDFLKMISHSDILLEEENAGAAYLEVK